MPADGLQYQLYIMAGMNGAGFSAGEGIREGRQEGFRSNPANPSITGRLDYAPAAGLLVGTSFFAGDAAGDIDSVGSVTVTVWSADARYNAGRLSLRAVGSLISIGDASLLNIKFGGNVADQIYGLYFEAAYNILPWADPETDEQLFLFGRFEKYNTQASTTGFPPLLQYNRNDLVVGLTYKPVYNVAVKADYTWLRNALNAGSARNTGQLNIGIGYFFF